MCHSIVPHLSVRNNFKLQLTQTPSFTSFLAHNFNENIQPQDSQKSSRTLKLESRERVLKTLLFPLFSPNIRTDTESHLLHILAPFLISCILQTEKPLVIPIPAVGRLVLGGEPHITGGGTDILDNLDGLLVVLGELGGASENSLVELGHLV